MKGSQLRHRGVYIVRRLFSLYYFLFVRGSITNNAFLLFSGMGDLYTCDWFIRTSNDRSQDCHIFQS